MKVSTINYELG